ncbi:MAG: hypothetical protein N5P05_004416 (plasmid) [Chroococcopsis gigantea SAG 12.99]|nr:hypothetical protein [Chroococcopsis gigantea SAG 12.99]
MPSDKEKLAIADLFLICAKLSFPLMLVGAGARILIFDKPYGVTGRTTTDWDWGVKVASWSDFEILTREMTAPPAALFKKTRVFHRFEHIVTKTLLDLIPFGEITRPDYLLSWPDEPELNTSLSLFFQDML